MSIKQPGCMRMFQQMVLLILTTAVTTATAVEWKAISRNSACESNYDGIRRTAYYDHVSFDWCKSKCTNTRGCVAIDFYFQTNWCNLFNQVCKNPTRSDDGGSSWEKVTITSTATTTTATTTSATVTTTSATTITETSTTTITTTTATATATTTTTYKPQPCHGELEAAGCGSRIPTGDCNVGGVHQTFAETHCPVMCGLDCTSTITTATSTVTASSTSTTVATTTVTTTTQTSTTTATTTTSSTVTTTSTSSTDSSTTTTPRLLNLHEQCDPRADLCDTSKDLECQKDAYRCLYVTSAGANCNSTFTDPEECRHFTEDACEAVQFGSINVPEMCRDLCNPCDDAAAAAAAREQQQTSVAEGGGESANNTRMLIAYIVGAIGIIVAIIAVALKCRSSNNPGGLMLDAQAGQLVAFENPAYKMSAAENSDSCSPAINNEMNYMDHNINGESAYQDVNGCGSDAVSLHDYEPMAGGGDENNQYGSVSALAGQNNVYDTGMPEPSQDNGNYLNMNANC